MLNLKTNDVKGRCRTGIVLVCLIGQWSFCPSYAVIEPAPPRRRIIGDPCGGGCHRMTRIRMCCLLAHNEWKFAVGES